MAEILRISCDACERLRRCLRISTKRGHEIDLCRECLLEAMAAIDETPAAPTASERRREEQIALSRRLSVARRVVAAGQRSTKHTRSATR